MQPKVMRRNQLVNAPCPWASRPIFALALMVMAFECLAEVVCSVDALIQASSESQALAEDLVSLLRADGTIADWLTADPSVLDDELSERIRACLLVVWSTSNGLNPEWVVVLSDRNLLHDIAIAVQSLPPGERRQRARGCLFSYLADSESSATVALAKDAAFADGNIAIVPDDGVREFVDYMYAIVHSDDDFMAARAVHELGMIGGRPRGYGEVADEVRSFLSELMSTLPQRSETQTANLTQSEVQAALYQPRINYLPIIREAKFRELANLSPSGLVAELFENSDKDTRNFALQLLQQRPEDIIEEAETLVVLAQNTEFREPVLRLFEHVAPPKFLPGTLHQIAQIAVDSLDIHETSNRSSWYPTLTRHYGIHTLRWIVAGLATSADNEPGHSETYGDVLEFAKQSLFQFAYDPRFTVRAEILGILRAVARDCPELRPELGAFASDLLANSDSAVFTSTMHLESTGIRREELSSHQVEMFWRSAENLLMMTRDNHGHVKQQNEQE